MIDEATIARVNDLGGLRAIAISHPHYYTTMIEWSRAFDNVPILLHEADRPWVMRPDSCIEYWSGGRRDSSRARADSLERALRRVSSLSLACGCGGPRRSTRAAINRRSHESRDRQLYVELSELLPLGSTAVQQIVASLEPLAYDRLYGAFAARGHGVVKQNAKQIVARSAVRVLELMRG